MCVDKIKKVNTVSALLWLHMTGGVNPPDLNRYVRVRGQFG